MSLIEELNDSDTLVIAATGYGNKLSLPVKDFFRHAGLNEVSKIIITDETKLKTLAGIPPEFPTFESLVTYLKQTILKHKYSRTIVTGTSGGGHTALLLGHLLKADYVVAFAPYPYLSIEEATIQNDPALHSMSRVLEKFDKLPQGTKIYLDLHRVLNNWNQKTKYYVHVSKYNLPDFKRSLYLSGIDSISIISHPFKGHAIASELKQNHLLESCFIYPYVQPCLFKMVYLHVQYLFRWVISKTINLTKRYSRRAKGARG